MDGIRIDKFLWAARFYKTRSAAAQAIEKGRVQVNGSAVKPAKEVKLHDKLQVPIGDDFAEVQVLALSAVRRDATFAQTLYQETSASLQRRQATAAKRKLQPEPARELRTRPTKRDRRQLSALMSIE